MVESPNGIYIAWNVFDDYATTGSLCLKECILFALNRLIKGKTLETNLPAQGVVTLMNQKEKRRLVNHLLYASPVKRGEKTEIIEDILPVYGTHVELRIPYKAKRVYLAPQLESIEFTQEDGILNYDVERFECHQMVVVDY